MSVLVAVTQERHEFMSNVHERLPESLRTGFIQRYEEAMSRSGNRVQAAKGPLLRYPICNTDYSIWMRPRTPDIILFYDIMLAEQYGKHHLNTVNAVIDCGANIGIASAYFLGRYGQAQCA